MTTVPRRWGTEVNQKDIENLADSIDNVREALGAMVAALVADGFTDEQAREIVTSLMTMSTKKDSDDDDI